MSLSFFTSLPLFGTVSPFNFSHSSCCLVIFHCGFNLNFLMSNGAEHLFICLLDVWVSCFVKCLLKSYVNFKLDCSFFAYCGSYLHILNLSFVRSIYYQWLLPMHDLFVIFFMVSFNEIILMKPNLSSFFLCSSVF